MINENTATITLSGRWDAKSSAGIEDAVLPLCRPNGNVLLDMARVNYMSSAGLRTMLNLHHEVEEQGSRLVLAGLSQRLRDIMSITGFLGHFEVYDSLEDANAALK